MIVERDKTFRPIVITLENADEVSTMCSMSCEYWTRHLGAHAAWAEELRNQVQNV